MKLRLLSILLVLAVAFSLVSAFGVEASAKTIAVNDKASFWEAYENANDGDVINVEQNITIDGDNSKTMKDNCLVTINLNGYTLTAGGGDNFGIGNNSALLIQNGTITNLDTIGSSNGIVILNGVNVTTKAWLGSITAWIVNNSNIAKLRTEGGRVNPGASDLHPLESNWPGSTGFGSYNFENSAPAMVGSGSTWKCLASLQEDFDQAKETGYNRVILLKDYTLTADSKLEASGITFNLGGYTLTTGDYSLSLKNASGTNTICNGTITGDLSMDSNAGAVKLSNLDVSGTVSNGSHPTVFTGGHYNTITSGDGEIVIKDGFFAGNDSDYLTADAGYKILGGYFVSSPHASNIEEHSQIVNIQLTEKTITYYYTVQDAHDWTYTVDGATFTATCDCCYCDVEELTLVAPSYYRFDNNPKEITLSATSLGGKTGISKSDVKYYVKGESTEMSGKPTAIGNYVAKLTIEGAGTATCEFKILGGPVSLTVGEVVTWHNTITAACTEAGTNVATVKLYQDMQESGDINIYSGQKITVDLNGYTIRATNNVFGVKSGGELTLDDTSTAQTGKLANAEGKPTVRGMDIAGKVTIKAGTISTTNTWTGGGLVINGGNVTMTGGAIKDCKSGSGGGVYINGGSFTMTGGTITGNTAVSGNGGAIYLKNGTVTLNGVAVKDNIATGNNYSFGGAIYQDNGTLNITNCTIDSNSATSGGGLYIRNSGANATISGGTLNSNAAPQWGGGAVWVNAGQLTVKDNCQIKNNSGKEGGAIGIQNYNGTPNVNIINCTIEGNKALTANGGGIVHACGGSLTIDGATIKNNTAPNGAGGGIYYSAGSLTVKGATNIKDNTCGGSGTTSNIWMSSSKTVTLANPVSTMKIGITLQNGTGDVTGTSSNDYSGYFASDSSNYKAYNNGSGSSQKVILSEHEHTWNYAVDATNKDTLKAWCSETFGASKCGNNTEAKAQTITIQAPTSRTYDGTAKSASIKDGKTSLGGITTLPAIKYQKKTGESSYEDLAEAPTNAGTYKASITIGSGENAKTAYVEYTISKAKVTVPNAISGLTYNTTQQTGVSDPAASALYTITGNKATDAGSHIANAILKDKVNYEWDLTNPTSDDQSINWSIAQMATSITVAPTATAITYGQTLADSKLSGGSASVAGSFAWATGTIVPKVADSNTTEYDVVFTPTDAVNYSTKVCKVKVAVNKKQLTVTAEDKVITFGDTLPQLTAKAEGLIGSDTIDYDFKAIAVEGAGIYSILPYGNAEQDNYVITFIGGLLTVNPAAKTDDKDNPAPVIDTAALKEIHDDYAAKEQYRNKLINIILDIDENVEAQDKALIEVKADGQQIEYIDASLFMIVKEDGLADQTSNIGGENNTLISVAYKFDFDHKTDIRVWRVHEGILEELTEKANAAGEYVEFDKKAGAIIIVACKYSTYAISYNDVINPTPATGDSLGFVAVAILGVVAGACMLFARRRCV